MPVFIQKGVDFRAPIAVAGNLRPTHFAGDDFIALWVVDVRLQQVHVFLRPLILLLEKSLPIVFVPNALTLALEARHDLTKSQLGCVRKDYSVIYEVALSSSRLVCRRNCPQAASMS